MYIPTVTWMKNPEFVLECIVVYKCEV